MKNHLTNAPILKITDPHKDFIVWNDTWIEGIGRVLMQDNYIVCYKSWMLVENEKNYVTHDLELVVVVHDL